MNLALIFPLHGRKSVIYHERVFLCRINITTIVDYILQNCTLRLKEHLKLVVITFLD